MKIISLSDYFVDLAEEICLDKFENDIMLILNNYSRNSIRSIISKIREDIKALGKLGVVFDNSLINIFCSMYLGLAWSMYSEGKTAQREENLIGQIVLNQDKEVHIEIAEYIWENDSYTSIVNDITTRYYTLYLSRHIRDTFFRMEIIEHPDIKNIVDLEVVIIEYLRIFGLKIFISGIFEEYFKLHK